MAYRFDGLTLTASWDITGEINVDLPDYRPPHLPQNLGGAGGTGFSISLGSVLGVSGSASISGRAWAKSLNVGGTVYSGSGLNVASLDCSGSVEASIPCYLCWEYLEADSPNPFAGDVVDAPPFRKKRYFLMGAGDATITASFMGMSGSYTADVHGIEIGPASLAQCSTTSGYSPYPTYAIEYTGYKAGSASITLTYKAEDSTLPPDGEGASAEDSEDEIIENYDDFSNLISTVIVPVGAEASAGGGSCSSSCSNGGEAGGTAEWQAPRAYNLEGVIRAMQGPFPESLTLYSQRYAGDPESEFDASSSFTRSYTQRDYQMTAGVNVHSSLITNQNVKHEFADVGVSIVRSSLTENEDEPLASRILFRGKGAEGLSLSQSETFTFEDYEGENTWSGTDEAAASIVSGRLNIQTATTGEGGGETTFTPARSLAGYRYLQVPLTSIGAADVPVRLSVGGYVWNLTTGDDSETETREIDLCAPDSLDTALVEADLWDTRWPVPTVTSPTSGPYAVTSVKFDRIPAGNEIVIGQLVLTRHNVATVDCVPTLYASEYHPATEMTEAEVVPDWPLSMGPPRVVSEDETTSYDFVRRFLLVNTDGRQGPEETDFFYTKTVGGVTGVVSFAFQMASIQKLADEINAIDEDVKRWPGWSASIAIPDPGAYTPAWTGEPPPEIPYYFNAATLLATEVFGGGITWTYRDNEVNPQGPHEIIRYGFDLPLSGLSAQPLYDMVEMCGMAGDAEGHAGGEAGIGSGGSIAPLALRCGTILRGGAHGLVFDEEYKPKQNENIYLNQGSSTVAMGMSRASDSYYHADYGSSARASQSADVVSNRMMATIDTIWTRHRHRVTLVAIAPPCEGLFMHDRHYFPFAPQFSDPASLPFENVTGLTDVKAEKSVETRTTNAVPQNNSSAGSE